jgi:hypothetical protein
VTVRSTRPTGGLAYLASPYDSPDESVRGGRFLLVCAEAARLTGRGRLIFSPIAHTHPIAHAGALPLPMGWDFWEAFARRMLQACDELIVLRLPGWRESQGVRAEIALAKDLGKRISHLYPRHQCERCGRWLAWVDGRPWKHVCPQRLPEMRPGEAS